MYSSDRLISLDVFRGITIAAMILVNFPGTWEAMYAPLEHADWVGTTPTDFIFPFFIFIVGISITLSFSKQLQKGVSKKQIAVKSIWRAAKIFGVGLALRLLPTLDFSRFELPGVLQRISIVFIACAFLFLYTEWRTHLFVGVGILFAYWLALMYIPVPGFGPGVLEPGKNLANWLDSAVFPTFLINKKGYDSEGILSTFPAIVTGISGLLAGKILQQKKDKSQIFKHLLFAGILLVLTGYGISSFFPIIKKIWTSSFMLVTAGWAFLVFALIYWLIEIQGIKSGTKPWIIFGSNAIAIYVLADVFETIFLQSGVRAFAMNAMQNMDIFIKTASLIWAIFSVTVCYAAGYLMYQKRVFIKL
ncbi:MAG TPA: heparan-alpha-glucosaminide N-acetyltransferase domain-containing protein [Draconibacterium sp.]|nr:heparan-alpha-glucosaminide N-acetyltransferase domain-containing protein [Draconibacterium sp.]